MLFPSEMHQMEIVGEVFRPWVAEAIAEAKRIDRRKRRQVAKLGIDMHEAIERALLGKRKINSK